MILNFIIQNLQFLYNYFIADWIEILGIITGLLCLYFEITENYLTWVFGIFSSALYTIFLYKDQLLSQMLFQVITIPISFYGIYLWLGSKYSKDKQQVQIKNLTKKGWIYLILISFITTIIMYNIELKYSNSNFILADCFSAIVGVLALYLVATKVIEQWFMWIIADGIPGMILFYQKHYLSSLLFMCYAILAIVGYFNWLRLQKSYAKNNTTSDLSNCQSFANNC